MATIVIGTPDRFIPAFNPVWFYLQSNHAGDEGFKFIADIYPSGSATRIARQRLFPRPNDLYGEIEISTIMKNYVSKFLNQNLHSFSNCASNYQTYNIAFGEEYVKYWSYLINYNSGDGFLTLSGNAETHNFTIGQEVILAYTTPNTLNDGVHTVIATPSTNAITVDIPFISGGSSSPNWGTAVDSSKRKTVFTGQTVVSGYTVWNGAIAHQDLMSYTSTTYNIRPIGGNTYTGGTSNNKLLTNVPNGYNVRPENSMWLNYYSTAMSQTYTLELTTNTGTFYYPNSVGGNQLMQTVAVGPYDINHFATSATCYDVNHVNASATTIFNCDTTEYSVRLVVDLTTSSIDTGGTITWGSPEFIASSEQKTFRYNQSYSDRNSNVEVYFMDRKSSFVPCNFELLSVRSIDQTSSDYQTVVGSYNAALAAWTFDSTESSTNKINTKEVQQLTVNTNWMTVDESNYFKELFTSKYVYIKEFGKLWPVIVKDTNLPLPTKSNKKNINKVLTLTYANNNAIQS